MEIIDQAGRIVYNQEVKDRKIQEIQIDISSIKKGLYFVKVILENKELTRKLIVE